MKSYSNQYITGNYILHVIDSLITCGTYKVALNYSPNNSDAICACFQFARYYY